MLEFFKTKQNFYSITAFFQRNIVSQSCLNMKKTFKNKSSTNSSSLHHTKIMKIIKVKSFGKVLKFVSKKAFINMRKILENDLIFRKIVKYFSLNEIIQFRRVCSSWKRRVESYLADQQILCLGQALCFNDPMSWYNPINFLNICRTMNLDFKAIIQNSFRIDLFFNHSAMLKNILELFPNIKELYFFNDDSTLVIDVLETLSSSSPGINKLMFEISKFSLSDARSTSQLTEFKQSQIKQLREVLNKFQSLDSLILFGDLRPRRYLKQFTQNDALFLNRIEHLYLPSPFYHFLKAK